MKKNKKKKDSSLGWVIIIAALILLLGVFYTVMNMKDDLAGEAFSYKDFTKMPFHFTNMREGNDYGFTYKGTLYQLTVTDVDLTNKKIKYEISKGEIDEDKDSKADLFIDHVSVEKVDDPYIYFKIIIKNIGTRDAYDTFYVTINSLDEDGDMYKSTYQNVEGLDSDEEITIFAHIKYDKDYYGETGKIKYEIFADSSNKIKESDETNNKEVDHYKE